MKNKISNYLLAESILKTICRKKGIVFQDIAVSFSPEEEGLYIKDTKNSAHTSFCIISNYLDYLKKITGQDIFVDKKEKEDFLSGVATSLRSLVYVEKSFIDFNDEELSTQLLYQRPLIWILMKDIICPAFDVSINNIKIVMGQIPQLDFATYYREGEINREEFNYPFIFLNEIADKTIESVFILVEAIKAHDLNVLEVMKYLFESEIYPKFKGLLKISFDFDSKVNQFLYTLIKITGVDWNNFIAKNGNKIDKMAQMQSPENANQFWFLGIMEGMLEPTRGSDWSTTRSLQPYVEEFWNKVEKIKEARGGMSLPFNSLLSLKNEEDKDCKVNTNKTLQSLLSSNRIW